MWNKQFAYVNYARIRSWNQPVLSNEGRVSWLRKQREPLMGLELTPAKHPPIMDIALPTVPHRPKSDYVAKVFDTYLPVLSQIKQTQRQSYQLYVLWSNPSEDLDVMFWLNESKSRYCYTQPYHVNCHLGLWPSGVSNSIFVSVLKIKRPKSPWCIIDDDTIHMYLKHISV